MGMTFSQSGKTDPIWVIPNAGNSNTTGSKNLYQYNSADAYNPWLRYSYGTGILYNSSSIQIMSAHGDISASHQQWLNPEWEDLRVPLDKAKAQGSNIPDFIQFKSTGGSTGVFAYAFDKNTEQELHFTIQLPHSYAQGTDLVPHVHWSPPGALLGNVIWGLEYTISNINGDFGDTTIVYCTGSTDGTAYKHFLTNFDKIADPGITISSMIVCRIFRAAGETADTLDSDAFALEFDVHYQMNSLGSQAEGAKGF